MATKTEKRVSKELREQARSIGLCDEWYNAWSDDCTYDELIDKFITGYDFCVEHDWPSPKYVTENFPLHVLRANCVFCDDSSSRSDLRNAVVMGRSSVELYYSDYTFGDVRVRHSSHVCVNADALSIVHVHAYDNSSVVVSAEEGAKVTLFVHSGSVNVTVKGKVKTVYGESKET